MLQSHQYRRLRRLRRLIDDNRVKRTSVAMVSANNLPAILPPLSAPIAFARPCHIFEQQLHTSTSASGAHDVGFRQHAMTRRLCGQAAATAASAATTAFAAAARVWSVIRPDQPFK